MLSVVVWWVKRLEVVALSEVQSEYGLVPHQLKFSLVMSLDTRSIPLLELTEKLTQAAQK